MCVTLLNGVFFIKKKKEKKRRDGRCLIVQTLIVARVSPCMSECGEDEIGSYELLMR